MPSLMFDKVGFSIVHYESCAMGIGILPLSLNCQAYCRWNSLCNDIGTSEHVLSTQLEGYFGGLWAELSIWAAQLHFRVFGELILRQPSQQKLPFLSTPHSCTVLNFCQNAPRPPHRVVVASLNICRWGVGCHAQTGRECQSYDPGDKSNNVAS